MRGGIVAVGIILVFLGLAPWIPAVLGAVVAPALGLGAFGTLTALSVVFCCLSPVLVIVGFLVFLAGLVAKSDAELAAMRPIYYAPPSAPPQVVVIQQPSPPTPPARRPPPPPTE